MWLYFVDCFSSFSVTCLGPGFDVKDIKQDSVLD